MLKTIALCLGITGLATAWQIDFQSHEQGFDELEFFMEANVLDGDSEIVLKVESKRPLQRLTIKDPFRQVVYDMNFDDPGGLGSSEIRVESGEPTLQELRLAFPEGWYQIVGVTQERGLVSGEAYLSHTIPSRFGILRPAPNASVDMEDAVVEWIHYPNVESYTLEIETGEDDKAIVVTVPGSVNQFQFPSVLLEAGYEHQLVITANGENGNKLVQEQYFTPQ